MNNACPDSVKQSKIDLQYLKGKLGIFFVKLDISAKLGWIFGFYTAF